MSEAVATDGQGLNPAAYQALKAGALLWFIAAIVGQWRPA